MAACVNALIGNGERDKVLNIPAVIIAGGSAERFGSPKGLAKIGDKTLLQCVLDRLRGQTKGAIALNAVSDGPYANSDYQILEDRNYKQCGPLAGLLTAFSYAKSIGSETVLTVPIDTPFLPQTLLRDLVDAGAPAITRSQGRVHPICGLWPVALETDLEKALDQGIRSATAWSELCGANMVEFALEKGRDPFLNINTEDDLAYAQSIAK